MYELTFGRTFSSLKCIADLALFQKLFAGGKIYCYANFYCHANFSIVFGQNFRKAKVSEGGTNCLRGCPPPLWKKARLMTEEL